ncbi:hypothetical protein HRE53_31680 (plasmid) [Acaryochloris sp. 'Moss Beach']|uniref:hypothetical protein n=1 Tax=Acaryochloris sp. 'Moss Beach' TaxID=2740837 RepID=UPI001F3A33FC|nr:hypothetical protein [Acaryochloris sp. 'Moss Beach']UJB73257.1 hypothetical protein HRE53_31680 [Acaryochloris sp. 'Moss Beach']
MSRFPQIPDIRTVRLIEFGTEKSEESKTVSEVPLPNQQYFVESYRSNIAE